MAPMNGEASNAKRWRKPIVKLPVAATWRAGDVTVSSEITSMPGIDQTVLVAWVENLADQPSLPLVAQTGLGLSTSSVRDAFGVTSRLVAAAARTVTIGMAAPASLRRTSISTRRAVLPIGSAT